MLVAVRSSWGRPSKAGLPVAGIVYGREIPYIEYHPVHTYIT